MSYSERENKFLQQLGITVRRLRQQRGWSQEALARKAKVGRSYLASIERGQNNFSALNLMKIAEALEVEVSRLLSGDQSDGGA